VILTGPQVYVGKLGNAYFYRNEIAGQTDFFYGVYPRAIFPEVSLNRG
jgi:hypothetical protein